MSALEAGRPYLSIGEVLNVLKDEFADVTVSKIRFLESEGLIQPERTPSGYRKFSAIDIERLRFILRQQRDHFLPLKVIRERLAEWEAAADGATQPATLFSAVSTQAREDLSDQSRGDEPAAGTARAPEPDATFAPIVTGVSMSRPELERASGLLPSQLKELETFGLVVARDADDGEARFNEIDLEVAKLSRDLIKLGLEPRHLRIFRSTADRWTALADQMVLPLVKQRNPEARRQASDTVRELVRTGNKLLQTLLREGLKAYHA